MNAQETLTITQCYELARNNYPLIRQYDLINQTEQYTLANASKGWLPQIAISAKATWQSDVTKLPFDSRQLSAALPGFAIPTPGKDQYQVVAELNQTIWDGGVIRSARQLATARATADRQQLESDLYALNEKVNQLYFGRLLQDELMNQNSLLQKELQVNINRVAAMMANGVANLSDRESLEVELLNARQHEIELKALREAYSRMLGLLIGRQGEFTLTLPFAGNEGALRNGEINRPELKAFHAVSLLTEMQNRQITAGLTPRIGLFVQGGYGRPGLNMLQNNFEPFYVAGLRVSWNIGKLYTLKNDRRKVETDRLSIDVQRDIFLFNIALQRMQQDTEIQKITALLEAGNQIVSLRTSIKKAAEAKLENGVVSVTDLIREINAEDIARQTVAANRIRRLMSLYNYMYTTNHN
ncbi:MAG: TolC family protein [Tannerellaceae bacterium]|jgi:outer membrane protein TolC|nr:TolC family protein [Tannerellaceae bacterium]